MPCLDTRQTACRTLDFAGADLSGRDLIGRDLAYSNLSGANLSGADLTNANLFGANLVGANLTNANLTGIAMRAADVRDADLTGADLTGADLSETNFFGADLQNARLDATLLQRTTFGGADLRNSSVTNAIATRVDLRETLLDGSDWTGSVTRAEYPHADDLDALGALVCGFTACSEKIVTTDTGAAAPVDPKMLNFALDSQLRTALAFLSDPPGSSRHAATTMLAGMGVYDSDLQVQGWTNPETGLPSGLQDAAALYAVNNASTALRFNTDDLTRNTILQPTEGPRDTILWRATTDVPETRAATVYAATMATAAALERAKNDGFKERVTTYDAESGAWRPTPPGFAPALQPGWGELTTFSAASRQCRAGAPVLDAAAREEVVTISKNLTPDQKAAARFWDDERIRTTNPIGHWYDIANQVVLTKLEDGSIAIGEAMRLMTELHMAMADTMIMVWSEKYTYRTARPITAIRETDPYWNSYLGNPPFPAYPSGHAAISTAAAEVLSRWLGEFEFTDNRFRSNSGAVETLNSKPRTYPNLRAAAREAALSRVWGGIHFMADAEGGQRIGLCVAGVHTSR